MKYSNAKIYEIFLQEELRNSFEKEQINDLMKTMANVIDLDSWYAVRLHKETRNDLEKYGTTIIFTIEVNRAETERIIIPSFEDVYFSDKNKTFFGKVKTCIKYLLSKRKS